MAGLFFNQLNPTNTTGLTSEVMIKKGDGQDEERINFNLSSANAWCLRNSRNWKEVYTVGNDLTSTADIVYYSGKLYRAIDGTTFPYTLTEANPANDGNLIQEELRAISDSITSEDSNVSASSKAAYDLNEKIDALTDTVDNLTLGYSELFEDDSGFSGGVIDLPSSTADYAQLSFITGDSAKTYTSSITIDSTAFARSRDYTTGTNILISSTLTNAVYVTSYTPDQLTITTNAGVLYSIVGHNII